MVEGLRASAGETVYLDGIKAAPAIKKKAVSERCPRCGVFVAEEYFVCPYCALPLKKECPRCKRPIPMNWNACSYCGNVLTPVNLPSEVAAKPAGSPLRIVVSGEVIVRGRCPHCGRLVLDDARYCDGCGWRVEEDKLSSP